MKKYTGGCHCGKVRFEVEMGEPKAGMTCNCSYCIKKGTVLTFAPAEHFAVTKGENELTHYRFNKNLVDHSFCATYLSKNEVIGYKWQYPCGATCGTQAFGQGKGPDGKETAAINLRCIDDIDLHALEISEYNGKDS